MDKDDLEEAKAATDFVNKAGVFDKEPAAESTPLAETTALQTSYASISTITFDKLLIDVAEMIANVAEVKANQADMKVDVAELKANVKIKI